FPYTTLFRSLHENVIGEVYLRVHIEKGVERVVMAHFLGVPFEDGIGVQRAPKSIEDVVGQHSPFKAVVKEGFPSIVPASWFQQGVVHEASGLEIEAHLAVRDR